MKPRFLFVSLLLLLFLTLNLFAQGHSDMFNIDVDTSMAGWPQVEFSPTMGVFLVVWEDYRNGNADIYGQLIESNGTPRGDNFPICTTAGDQYWPHLAYDSYWGRFLVVFEDWRDPNNGDIRGIFVTQMGTFYHPANAEADDTFLICSNPANIYTCSVAFNWRERVYLVVWGDFRNDPTNKSFTGADVFGQLVSDTGELLPPPTPADGNQNFMVAANPAYDESVADVSYSPIINEFLVVYGTSTGLVLGQRVDHTGKLIAFNGKSTSTISNGTPFMISDLFSNGPDCMQAKVQFNSDNYMSQIGWCEAEVIWKGIRPPDRKDNDLWGQRIAFTKENDKYVVWYVNLAGDLSQAALSNHSISQQTDFMGVADIAYNRTDNEFLVAWGDPRTNKWQKQDLYGQRLWVHGPKNEMTFLADDRAATVTDTENIPYFVSSDKYEGSLVGVAYSPESNSFLVAFTYEDPALNRKSDIMGFLVHGQQSTNVAQRTVQPDHMTLYPIYPNPFNASAKIRFSLQHDCNLSLKVFDMSGREIETMVHERRSSGEYEMAWDAQGAPSGIYVIQLKADDMVQTRKMVLIK